MMRTFLLGALFCVILGLSPALAGEAPLPIAFEDYPPYEYEENGQARGINIDLIREAFRRMGMTPVFELRPWKRALLELRTGDILALSSGFKTPEREAFACFPPEPLAEEVNVIAVPQGSELRVASLDDLSGLSVGVVRDYTYGSEFDALRSFRRVEANTSQQLLDMLLNGRMDAAMGNRAVFEHQIRKMGRGVELRYIYEIGRGPLYLFFSRAIGNQKAEALARDFGAAIRAMRDDGAFDAIQAKY
jgi:polar amino acid transport system substrate-binding protein